MQPRVIDWKVLEKMVTEVSQADQMFQNRLNEIFKMLKNVEKGENQFRPAEVDGIQDVKTRLENMERQLDAVSHVVGVLSSENRELREQLTALAAVAPAIAQVEKVGIAKKISETLDDYGFNQLPLVKQKILDHIARKRELFYPAEVARELNLCSTYVSKVLRDLEKAGWLKSVDSNGYRGRKLYKVVKSGELTP